jgi:hypothetical protein
MMRALMFIVVSASLALAACAQREPVSEHVRAYQGKPDTRAWDNAPLAYE